MKLRSGGCAMFPKIILFVTVFVVLTACAAPGISPSLTPISILDNQELTLTPTQPVIVPSETLAPTPTPEATAVPEALPEGAVKTIRVGDYTYAVDKDGNKIYRESPDYDPKTNSENEQWQPRYVLPYIDVDGNQLYDAWVIETKSVDISSGEAVDNIILQASRLHFDLGYGTIIVGRGYITNKIVVEVNKDSEKANLTLFDLTVFLKDNKKVVLSLSGLEKRLNTGGNVKGVNLGQMVMAQLLLSASSSGDFSSNLQQQAKEFQGYTQLETELSFGNSNPFYSFEELVKMLKSVSDGSVLDLRFHASVDQLDP